MVKHAHSCTISGLSFIIKVYMKTETYLFDMTELIRQQNKIDRAIVRRNFIPGMQLPGRKMLRRPPPSTSEINRGLNIE